MLHTNKTRLLVAAGIALLVAILANPAQPIHGEIHTPDQPVAPASAAVTTHQVFLPLVTLSNASLPIASLPQQRKGIGLTYDHCGDANAIGAKWQYDWSPTPVTCSGIDDVPMISGESNVASTVSGNSRWLMGFNEPDDPAQANLSPSQAATLWRTIEQKYPDRKLLAPAPSAAHPEWLTNFWNAYQSAYHTAPRLDGLAVHCYAYLATDCVSLTQRYISQAQAWGVPEVWVTEFAFLPCNGFSVVNSDAQMSTYINWLETQPLVTRYAWFAARIQGTENWAFSPQSCNAPLVDYVSSSPTTIGQVYARMP